MKVISQYFVWWAKLQHYSIACEPYGATHLCLYHSAQYDIITLHFESTHARNISKQSNPFNAHRTIYPNTIVGFTKAHEWKRTRLSWKIALIFLCVGPTSRSLWLGIWFETNFWPFDFTIHYHGPTQADMHQYYDDEFGRNLWFNVSICFLFLGEWHVGLHDRPLLLSRTLWGKELLTREKEGPFHCVDSYIKLSHLNSPYIASASRASHEYIMNS